MAHDVEEMVRPTCRRSALCVVVGLSLGTYSSSLVSPFIVVGLRSGPTRFHWVSSLLVVLLFVVGSSFLLLHVFIA
jgi:uncharacterized membrane protein YqaE (UPF0057 family)